MVIKDCVRVTGRGTILICDLPNDLFSYVDDFVKIPKCKIGDKIYIEEGFYYNIIGIEKLGNLSNTVGLVINTNESVEFFKNKKFSLCQNFNQL